MRQLAIIIVIALIPCSTALPQTQEEQDANYVSALRQATRNSWNKVIQPAFVKAASNSDEADAIRDTKVYVENYADINAWADSDTHRIHIALGLIFAMNNIADAMLYCRAIPDKWHLLPSYIQKLADVSKEGMQAGYSEGLPTFWEYAHIPLTDAQQISSAPDYGDLKAGLMCEQLALVLGHESGHIVKHHLPYKSKTPALAQADEKEADQYGYLLAQKAGFHPAIGVATVFIIFAYMENGAIKDDPSATHPAALHRIADLLTFVINDVNAMPDTEINPGLEASLHMNKQEWIQQAAKLQKLVEQANQ